MTTLLCQWLATSYTYMLCSVGGNLLDDLVKMYPVTTKEGVFAITIGAAERATRQADKYSWFTRITGFALQGVENLGDF